LSREIVHLAQVGALLCSLCVTHVNLRSHLACPGQLAGSNTMH